MLWIGNKEKILWRLVNIGCLAAFVVQNHSFVKCQRDSKSQFSPKETNFTKTVFLTNRCSFHRKKQILPKIQIITKSRSFYQTSQISGWDSNFYCSRYLTFYNCVQLHSVIKEYLAPTLTNTRCEALTLTPILTSIQVGGCGHEGFCLPHSLQNMHLSGIWSESSQQHGIQKIQSILSGKYISKKKKGEQSCNIAMNSWFFFQGESAYNFSLVGWGGHLPGGGVKASVKEVLDTVRINTPEEVRLMIRTSSRCHRGKIILLERWGCQLGCGSFQRGERKLALIWSCQVIQFGWFDDASIFSSSFFRKGQLSTQLPHPWPDQE